MDLSDNSYMLGIPFAILTSKDSLNPSSPGKKWFSSTPPRKLDPASGAVGCFYTLHMLPTLGVI